MLALVYPALLLLEFKTIMESWYIVTRVYLVIGAGP
jgi:hypothetical protein